MSEKDLGVEPSLRKSSGIETEATIYVVQGSTGEYSDHREWLVHAFRHEADAQAEVEFLTAKWMELRASDGTDWEERHADEEAMRVFDPGFFTDYTGSHWNVLAVDLVSARKDGSSPPQTTEVQP